LNNLKTFYLDNQGYSNQTFGIQDINQELLEYTSVKYVVVPIIDTNNDDNFFQYYRQNNTQTSSELRDEYIENLDKLDFLEKIDIGTQELVIYRNKNYVSKIFYDFDDENKELVFNRYSLTHYTLPLQNITEKTDIVFSETYSSDWKIQIGTFNWINTFTNKNILLSDNNHTRKYNVNVFTIDPEYIKANFDKSMYKENPDGSIDVELTLYFKPQSYFYLGIIISGTTLILCLGYLGYTFYHKRKKNSKFTINSVEQDKNKVSK
jgi:hypothetical protein